MHHALILEYNEISHAHDHYNYFRALLASEYSALDEMLERVLIFLEQVSGVPVLLSMIVLIFAAEAGASGLTLWEVMPASLWELYNTAIAAALRRRLPNERIELAKSMMRRVAVHNHFSQQRQFQMTEVVRVLSPHPEELALWNSLHDNPQLGIPLVKTLERGDGVESDSLYQMKHLSFQEGLFVQELVSNPKASSSICESDRAFSTFLNDPFYLNACRIGAGKLGSELSERRDNTWRFSNHKLTTYGQQALCFLLPHNMKLETLDLSGNGEEWVEPIKKIFVSGHFRARCFACDGGRSRRLELAQRP